MKDVVRRLKRMVSPLLLTLPLFKIFYCRMSVLFLTTPILINNVIVVWCIKYCSCCFCNLHFSCSWKIYSLWILSIVVRYCIFIFFRWVRRCVGMYVCTYLRRHASGNVTPYSVWIVQWTECGSHACTNNSSKQHALQASTWNWWYDSKLRNRWMCIRTYITCTQFHVWRHGMFALVQCHRWPTVCPNLLSTKPYLQALLW